ncbi:hypothetical protein [Shewanella atlantica]|nr:hypothetical protein [Shewanella atlantica]
MDTELLFSWADVNPLFANLLKKLSSYHRSTLFTGEELSAGNIADIE